MIESATLSRITTQSIIGQDRLMRRIQGVMILRHSGTESTATPLFLDRTLHIETLHNMTAGASERLDGEKKMLFQVSNITKIATDG